MEFQTMVKELYGHVANRFRPIKENTVFFDSFHGRYSDNPKYISEKLHEMAPNVKIVWSCAGQMKNWPDYIETVGFRSKVYYEYVNTAKVVVDNHTGLREFGFRKRRYVLLEKFAKRNGQLCISTWHGTPLKKIGRDILPTPRDYMPTSANYMAAGCQYTADMLSQAFCFEKSKIMMCGTPRNDLLFKQNIEVDKLKEKLGLPLDKKVVLFAPTYRDHVEAGIKQLELLDIPALLQKLDDHMGAEYVFVTRVHHYVLDRIQDEKLLKTLKERAIDGNVGDDMAEYLACTDVLITDYSGSLFDFAITGKPCFLFVPDKAEYLRDRGLYLDFDDLPFPMAEKFDDLLGAIEKFSPKAYGEAVDAFQTRIGNVEDGQASLRIVEEILAFL